MFSIMLKKTPVNKIWRKHRERIASGGSEKDTFRAKWYRNKGKSDLTGKFFPLDEVQSYQFAHALPKGMYPEYRNHVNNIIFVDSIEQHERVDHIIAGKKSLVEYLMLKWELAQRIKEQYQNFRIKTKQCRIH